MSEPIDREDTIVTAPAAGVRAAADGPARSADDLVRGDEVTAPAAGLSGDDPRPVLPPGQVIGGCEVVGLLGRGGMGAVYEAVHLTLERRVAVKLLDPISGDMGLEHVQRFLREARSTAGLDHHNIVSVYNAGEQDGRLFIEMQLVDGEPLSAKLRSGPQDLFEATRCVEQIAHALGHAHRRNIVHRDVKPENVLVTGDGVVKLVDFGIARPTRVDEHRLTSSATVMGTPSYMAPEQCQDLPLDGRADLYALGVTYFQLVTGELPYRSEGLMSLLRMHVDAPVPSARQRNPAVPEEMSALIAGLMAKEPEDRPQSAAELIGALRRLEAQLLGEPAPGTAGDGPAGPDSFSGQTVPSPPAGSPLDLEALRGARVGRSLVVLALVLLAKLLVIDALGVWERPELFALDVRQALRSSAPSSLDPVLLLVDEDDGRRYGLPLDREKLAEVLDGLRGLGATAIALDLLVSDPSPGGGDAMLAGATADSPDLVHAFLALGDPSQPPAEGEDRLPERFAIPGAADDPALAGGSRLTAPLPRLLKRARHVGNVGVVVDPDGTVRRVPLLIRYDGRLFPSLSLMAAARVLGAEREHIRWQPGGPLTLAAPGRAPLEIPVDAQGCLLLSVRGGLQQRTRYTLREVVEALQGGEPALRARLQAAVRGRAVLVGVVSAGHTDIHAMPGMPAAPLVLAHSMAMETLLARDFLRPVGLGLRWLLVALLLLGGLAAASTLRWSWAALAVAAAGALYGGAVVGLFVGPGLVLPVFSPLVALAVGALVGGLLRYRSEQLQRRRLSDALGRYLPGSVASSILSDPKALRLGGQRKELSLLAVRLQGFGALSEQIEPEEVGQLLQPFFRSVADIVFAHGGTLDRFSGEGVRAFFGDPLPQADHSRRAVACALDLRAAGLRVVHEWAAGGRRKPALGLGVHTGYVTVGNIGVVQRMEYTVLGRNVDRVEELAARAPNIVLVSARTRALTEEAFVYAAQPAADGEADGPAVFEAVSLR